MSDLVAKGCGIMRTETDGGAVCEWYYANGQERMDWPEDGVKAFLAAVLDDLMDATEGQVNEAVGKCLGNFARTPSGRITLPIEHQREFWQAMLAAKRAELNL